MWNKNIFVGWDNYLQCRSNLQPPYNFTAIIASALAMLLYAGAGGKQVDPLGPYLNPSLLGRNLSELGKHALHKAESQRNRAGMDLTGSSLNKPS